MSSLFKNLFSLFALAILFVFAWGTPENIPTKKKEPTTHH
jgi:hypothetical protein